MPTAKLSDIVADHSTGGMPGASEAEPKAQSGTPDGKTRRVTGSADIPLNSDGKAQAKELAKDKATKPFDKVFTSPEKRAVQTAKEFGQPIILSGLDAWARGGMEGKPVEQVKGQIKYLMLNPDKKPPGKSPVSGEPGESLNEFSRQFLATVQALELVRPEDERWLVISHGGNLQTWDAWIKAGCKPDLTFDLKKMAATPYWSVLGVLYRVGHKNLEEVANDDSPGLFTAEHLSTDFNSAGSGSSDSAPSKPSATPSKPEPKAKATPAETGR